MTRWRTVDIVVASVLGVAFGVVFWAWNILWNATTATFAGFPPSQALLSLFQNVDRLKLDFDRYVTTRPGQSVTRVELAKLAQESP